MKKVNDIIMLLAAMLLLSSCHTAKQTNKSETASAVAAAGSSQDLSATQRERLDHSLTLQLDDMEILFSLPVADGHFPGEMTDSVAGLARQEAPSTLGNLRVPARLRAKKATITSAAAIQHEDVIEAHTADSTYQHESSQRSQDKTVDTTTVAKPVPPWATVLIILLVVVFLSIGSRFIKQR